MMNTLTMDRAASKAKPAHLSPKTLARSLAFLEFAGASNPLAAIAFVGFLLTLVAFPAPASAQQTPSPPAGEIVLTLPDEDEELKIDEGASKTIEVELSAQPSASVTVTLAKTNADITLSRASLTFKGTDWDTAQSVTLTAGQDADATDDEDTLTLSATGGITASDIAESIVITDDEDGGIAVSAAAIELVEGSEDDRSKTFTVELGVPPASKAVLSLSSGDPAAVTVSPARLNFEASNYDKPQVVTVTAANDEDSADETVDITVSVVSGITATSVKKSVEVSDDDAIVVSPTDALTIWEGDDPRSLAISLDRTPSANVTLTLSKTNAKVTITPATLTFTEDNHSTPQIVKVSADYDNDASTNTDTITLSAAGGGIEVPDETVALTINEPRSRPVSEIVLNLPDDELKIAEGSSEDITVELGARPSSIVILDLTKTNPDITLSRSTLTFNTSNWDTAQSVTVTASADDDATDDEDTLTLSVYSGGIVALQLVESIAITDDDGSIVLSAAAVNLTEGSEDDRSKTFTVKLGAPPASSAVLSVTSGDTAVATVSPATLTFSASDYDQEQTVTVTAVDDEDSADETVDITVKVSSGITAADVKKSIGVSDDDGMILIDPDPIKITEGSHSSFAVRLSGAPASSANAVLSVVSADTSVATVSPATLTFTSSNYNKEQMVRVSAVGDGDGTDDSVEIALSVSSGYTDVDDVKKSVMVVDDDGEIVVSSASVSLDEIDPPDDKSDPYTPDTGTFTVELDAPPASKAVVSVTNPDPRAVTVSPPTLTFSASNYDDPQEVTITALSDEDGTSEEVAIVLSIAEEGYTAADKKKDITVRDDDPEIVFDKATMTLREGGAADRFLVSLGSPPSSSATFKVGSQGQDKDAVRVTPAILTFTSDNYKDAQAVTVSAVEDSDTSNENLTVTVSSDQGYAGASERITVEVIDDDGIVLSVPSLTLNEGDEDVPFYVSLGGIPDSGNAVVSLSSADTGAVTVTPATLTFTSTNYATGQMVKVNAVEDDGDASDHEVHITLTAVGYNAPNMTMVVHVIDDEGGIILGDSDLMTLKEGDATGKTFKVNLESRISSDAVLSLTIDDPEGRCASTVAGTTDETACPITVSPRRLTFTSVNYSTDQPVTVTSRYDNDDQDEEDIVITIAATEGMTAKAVTKEIKVQEPVVDPEKQINNLPDGKIDVRPAGAIDLVEGGIGAEIEVSIDAQPTSTVTVSILSSDSHVAVFPTSLTFDAYGWKASDKRKITLSTRPDANDVDNEVTITFAATGGIDAMPVKKKVNVKDTLSGSELIVYPNGALHIGEGGTGTLSVKLGSQPAAETTVSLSNANDDITLHDVDDERFQSTLSSLVFTPSNWNDPQTFIVRAKVDTDAENDIDTIFLKADGFSDRRIDVMVTDGNDDLPVRAYALAIPPASVQDSSTLRVHCKDDTPCQVMLDCNAQNDGSSFEGWIPRSIPAHGGLTLDTADIERYTGASWSGKGRLGCALRSEQMISAQVWTRSGDGVLVNNSAALRSLPEGSGYRVDIESIPSPDTPEESNLRIRCLAPDAQDCVGMRLSCFSDDGTMHRDGSITVGRFAVRHLQSEELVGMIGHRWIGMGLACEIYSDHPFTVQVLTRTGGGGALVNNSATGRRDR